MGTKQYIMAIKCFEEALKYCPDDKKWIIYKKLGKCHMIIDSIDKRINISYMHAIINWKELNTFNEFIRFNEIQEKLETELKSYRNKAIECFEKALKDCPNEEKWKIFIGLGLCYLSKGDYNKVIECYEEALKYCPKDKKGIVNVLKLDFL